MTRSSKKPHFMSLIARKLEWRISEDLILYPAAIEEMERRVASIREGHENEMVWLLEHPPLYSAGTSAKSGDLLDPKRFPVYQTGRGGQYTYHGPGQRIAYVMLDLAKRNPDIRAFVHDLEAWVILALRRFGIEAERRENRVGLWVANRDAHGDREDKIAAIGVRIRKWVSYHGISVNVAPNLSHFSGIVPCGIQETQDRPLGVTSLAALGVTASMAEFDHALQVTFPEIFGE